MTESNIEREIIALAHDWDRAMVANDASAIGRFMADDWTIVGADGRISDKATFLALIRSGALKHDVMQTDDITVRVYGDAALLLARGISGGSWQGQPFREVERQSNLFVRQGAQWRCVLTHLSRLGSEQGS